MTEKLPDKSASAKAAEDRRRSRNATPTADAIPAVGGAMNLAIGAKRVLVMMTLFAKDGSPKLVPECTYPLTGVGCVDRVYTDHAIFDLDLDGAVVTETFGISYDDLADRLDLPLRGA